MSLRRVSILSATVLTLSLGGAVALANANPFLSGVIAQNPENRFERKEDRLFQELNLTPEQTKRIEAIQNQYRDQTSQGWQAARQARQELFDLMAGTAPESAVREKQSQVATLMQQVHRVYFERILAIREVLKPEQRSQLAERMKNRFGEFKNRHMNRSELQG